MGVYADLYDVQDAAAELQEEGKPFSIRFGRNASECCVHDACSGIPTVLYLQDPSLHGPTTRGK